MPSSDKLHSLSSKWMRTKTLEWNKKGMCGCSYTKFDRLAAITFVNSLWMYSEREKREENNRYSTQQHRMEVQRHYTFRLHAHTATNTYIFFISTILISFDFLIINLLIETVDVLVCVCARVFYFLISVSFMLAESCKSIHSNKCSTLGTAHILLPLLLLYFLLVASCNICSTIYIVPRILPSLTVGTRSGLCHMQDW